MMLSSAYLEAKRKCLALSNARYVSFLLFISLLFNIFFAFSHIQSFGQNGTAMDNMNNDVYPKQRKVSDGVTVKRNESSIQSQSKNQDNITFSNLTAKLKKRPNHMKSNGTINFFSPPMDKEKEVLTILKEDAVMGGSNWHVGCIVVESHQLVFCFVPKVGCTIFKQLFRRMMGKEDWRGDPHYLPGLKFLRDYEKSTAIEFMTSRNWTRAIFFRDPKERLLSSWLDKAFNKHGFYMMAMCCQCTKGEAGCIIEHPRNPRITLLDGCIERLRSFENFVHHIDDGVCSNDPHWRPQTERIEEKFLKYINFVGHMDSIAEDTERLLRMVGAWDQYGSHGWGKYHNESIFRADGVYRVTSAKTKFDEYFTPELERIAERIYAKDYNHSVFNVTL